MTILITGATGFVGLHVATQLLARGDSVVLNDLGALPPLAEAALAAWRSRYRFVQGDILDALCVDSLFSQSHIDRVVHCAAITAGPRREAEAPASIINVNLNGLVGVLEAARRHSVRRFIYVGSGAAYGESLYRMGRLTEETPSVPGTMYSITKHAAERLALRLGELWNVDVRCVRLGTVIGPWERDTGARDNYGTHTQLAGYAVRGETAILTQREIRRDWVYAKDVAGALLALLDTEQPSHRLYNVSSGVEWTAPIARWCEALRARFPGFDYRIAGPGDEPNIWYTDKDRGIMETGRLEYDLGYAPRYQMDAAYTDFLDWIAANPDFYRRF